MTVTSRFVARGRSGSVMSVALRSAGAIVLGLVGMLVYASPASATVAVSPDSVNAGATVDLALTVTNDNPALDMTQVDLGFLGAGAVPNADPPTHIGWSSSVDSGDTGVLQVTWSRGKLAPGASATFVVTITAPKTGDVMRLPVVQTFSDGTVVRWTDQPNSGAHPSPEIAIAGGIPVTTTTSPAASGVTTTVPPNSEKKKEGNTRVGEVVIGLGVAALAYVYLKTKNANKLREEAEEESIRLPRGPDD